MEFLIISIVISLILTIVLFSLFMVFEKLTPSNEDKNGDAYKKAMGMLTEARQTSLHIIKDAHVKALRTLDNSSIFNKDLRREVEESIEHLTHKHYEVLDNLSTELENSFKSAVLENKDKSISTLEEASNDMREEIVKEVQGFRQTLEKQTVESENLAQEKITAEYEELKKELEAYKDRKLKEVDDQIYSIVIRATEEIIGKSLDMSLKEELVIQSLEKAKQDGVFEK